MSPLGDLEALVMGIAWENPQLTVRELCEQLEGDDRRAYTTIMTTMDRLHRKGMLHRRKDGNAWRYRPAVSQDEFEHRLADQLATEIVTVHGDVGLAAFLDAASVEPEMLDRLEAMIAARRSGK